MKESDSTGTSESTEDKTVETAEENGLIRTLKDNYIKVIIACIALILIVVVAVLIFNLQSETEATTAVPETTKEVTTETIELKSTEPTTIEVKTTEPTTTKSNTTAAITTNPNITTPTTTEPPFITDNLTPVERFVAEIDKSVNPCDDFYQYTCGIWKKKNRGKKSTLSYMKKDSDEVVKKFFETSETEKLESYLKHLKTYLFTCYNYSNTYGDKERAIVFDIFKKLPSRLAEVKKEKDGKYHFMNSVTIMRSLGLGRSHFFQLKAIPYVKNEKFVDEKKRIYIIRLEKPEFIMTRNEKENIDPDEIYSAPEEKLSQKPYYERYVKEARRKMENLNLNVTSAADKILGEKVLQFEAAMYKNSKERNLEYVTLKNLVDACPKIIWKIHFDDVFNEVQSDQVYEVFSLEYFKKLNDLIKKFGPEVMADYIYVKTAAEINELVNINNGQCLEALKNYTYKGLAVAYVKGSNIYDDVEVTRRIFDYIKMVIKDNVKNMEWMSPGVKTIAKDDKIETISSGGFPFDKGLFDNNLANTMKGLKSVNDNFLQNILYMRMWHENYNFGMIKEETYNKDMWEPYLAYRLEDTKYSHFLNVLTIGMEMLQEPVYDIKRPNYMNFATIGFIIAQGLMQSIVGRGSGFDGFGNKKQWWDAESNKSFIEKRLKCLEDQYSNFTHPNNLKLPDLDDEMKTEIYNDRVALKMAKEAYIKWEKKYDVEKEIPGYEYNDHQIFWISFARIWCRHVDNESWDEDLKRNQTPPIYKVLETLRNLEEFSKDFNCTSESKMNPKKKCKVL